METGPHKAEPPKRKRRWFQFSLRTLMVFTLVCAIPFAWLGRRIEQKRGEREAVAAIVKLGGSVSYDYEKASWEWEFGGSAPIGEVKHAKPPGPDWLRNLLGENFFSEVVNVSFHGVGNVPDAGLINVKGLTQLQTLGLRRTNITDAGLEYLKELSQLRDLDLSGTNIGDAGIGHLKGLVELRTLKLIGTKVTDAGLEHLTDLSQLRELDLRGTQIGDAGMEHIKRLTQLHDVNVNRSQVTDAGVAELHRALPNCQISR